MIRNGFSILIIGGAIGGFCGFISLLLLSDFLTPGLESFLDYLILDSSNPKLSKEHQQSLEVLLSEGVVSSPQDLLDKIVSFYTVVIELLIALIGVIGVSTIFYIKASSEEKIIEMTQSTVDNQFDKQNFYTKVEGFTNTVINPKLDELSSKISSFERIEQASTDIDEHLKNMDQQAESVEKLKTDMSSTLHKLKYMESVLAQLDSTEQIDDEILDIEGGLKDGNS